MTDNLVNKDSSVGITEDLITNIMHLCASEYHLNILIRKYEDQLTFWYADGDTEFLSQEDSEAVQGLDELIFMMTNLLNTVTENRRNAMKKLKEQANEKGNQDMWCLLKHVLTATITAFEVWQVDIRDVKTKQLFIDQSRIANQVIAMFLGYEVTPCSACLTDMLKEDGK